MKLGVNEGVGVVCWSVRAPTHTLNTYLRKLESWDQYGGMYVCVCVKCVCVARATTLITRVNTLLLTLLNA